MSKSKRKRIKNPEDLEFVEIIGEDTPSMYKYAAEILGKQAAKLARRQVKEAIHNKTAV